MVSELIDKYLWLVQTLVDAGRQGLSLPALSDRWTARYGGYVYSRQTFYKHRTVIADLLGIEIVCDRSTHRYYIDAGESAVDKRQAMDWMVNTFTVNSLLTLGKERLSGRVSVEDIPSGQKYLTAVMEAMLENAELEMRYQKYLHPEIEICRIHPYAVREFAKRWYVVAYSVERAALRVYGMDRIQALERTGAHFRMPEGFDVETLFASSYGIYLPEDTPPVLVKLRATRREALYLQDLPLHPSQTLVSADAQYSVFALRVIPNPGFIMELCRHGDRLEVLSPRSLREQVAETLRRAVRLYDAVPDRNPDPDSVCEAS